MVTTIAPDLTPGYPSKGPKLGPAWARVWNELAQASRRKDAYLDGRELAASIAPDYGLEPATLVALLSRAAKAGLIDRTGRAVAIEVRRPNGTIGTSSRTRTHYAMRKVKADV